MLPTEERFIFKDVSFLLERTEICRSFTVQVPAQHIHFSLLAMVILGRIVSANFVKMFLSFIICRLSPESIIQRSYSDGVAMQ